MNRSLILGVIFWGFFSSIFAQEMGFNEASLVFGDQRILKFRKFSLELTDESYEELQEIQTLIKLTPGIIKTNLLVIQIFTCPQELVVKPYIGVCRGQVIIDYLEEMVGMPRKKCLIRDAGANQYDEKCLVGSGVNIYLKPDWRERK